MSCEHYKEALIESANTGAEPQGEFRAHLEACTDCRHAFAQEQSLFTAIDTGLHTAVNTEVPPSFLPRVDARLAEKPVPRFRGVPGWVALTGAAAMTIAFFAAGAVWHTSVAPNGVETSATTNAHAARIQSPRSQNLVPVPPAPSFVPGRRPGVARTPVSHEPLSGRNSEPEVLVPRDQEVLVVRYAEQWRGRRRAPLLAEDSGDAALAPLQVAQIQIAQLDVKLLAKEHAQ